MKQKTNTIFKFYLLKIKIFNFHIWYHERFIFILKYKFIIEFIEFNKYKGVKLKNEK